MTKRTALAGGVVGGLAVVEFTSGVIQGYYTPLFSDIARKLAIHDADINWLEAVQLLLSAIVVPASALAAASTAAVPSFCPSVCSPSPVASASYASPASPRW